jgi:catechol 2,3-dioxygenase-like lactoylglutathione lyase family enzyme
MWTSLARLPHLRIARPVRDLATSADMYRRGLGLSELGRFEGHAGFDGVMLGHAEGAWHFELTWCRTHPVVPTPTPEDLLVLYIPEQAEWDVACARMRAAGFKQVPSFNPYWDASGCTFEDHDGYRIVLQRERWRKVERIA